MSEKCKECNGTGPYYKEKGTWICPACDGTGVDLSTCEGVPPGSDVVKLAQTEYGTIVEVGTAISDFQMRPWVRVGIRFPSRIMPDGTRETLDPDPGRYWRRR